MSNDTYMLKLSPQGQITLPKALREQLHADSGQRVAVRLTTSGELTLAEKPPITQYFGSMGDMITGGRDAAEYIREMRDKDSKHRLSKLGL